MSSGPIWPEELATSPRSYAAPWCSSQEVGGQSSYHKVEPLPSMRSPLLCTGKGTIWYHLPSRDTVLEIKSNLEEHLPTLAQAKELRQSTTHYGKSLPTPSDQKKGWGQLLELVWPHNASACCSEPWGEQAEPIVCKSEVVALFTHGTWAVGQPELKQQTKSFTSIRVASPLIPGQTI